MYGKIKSFNQYGELIIEFSEIMNTNFNISNLNSSISNLSENVPFYNASEINKNVTNLMQIYVIPAMERNIDERYFELQQLNLTWRATNYTVEFLHIQVDFLNGTYTSPLTKQDTLVVSINPDQ